MLSCNSHKHISPSTRFVVNTPKPTRGGTRCTYSLLQGRHLGHGPWQMYDDPVILQSLLLLYIHIYRHGITYPCSPRAASWQGRALSWTPRGPASVRQPPQSVRRTPAARPAYAYCFGFRSNFKKLHQSLLEGWHRLQSVRSWRTEPS